MRVNTISKLCHLGCNDARKYQRTYIRSNRVCIRRIQSLLSQLRRWQLKLGDATRAS